MMVGAPKKTKKLWQGAIYLSLAAVVIKILSAVYRVPYQNIAGDVGFYVYQQIYPIYGIAILLSTYGFPVIISKLISERVSSERDQIVKSAFLSLFLISVFVFLLFYANAPYLAKIMGDELLETPLRAVSFTFFVIPLLSVMRGYFQGKDEMLPTAVSQVTEQITRVCAILLFTYFLMTNGFGPYAAGTGAATGSVIGGFIGFMVLYIFYIKQKGTVQSRHHKNNRICLKIVKTVLVQGIMICFSSLILIIFQLIDSVTVLRFLLESGVHLEIAKVSKGVFDRGQPLIQMGTVITTSFSLIVVPLIAKVNLSGRKDLIEKYSRLSIKISFLVGAAASVGLAVIIEPTNVMLFKDHQDSLVLAVMGMAIVFTAVFLTSSAILHGLNKVHVTVIHVNIGILVKLILNVFLIPITGTLGAAIATVAACAVCAILNLISLQRQEVLRGISLVKGSKVVISLVALGSVTFLWQKVSFTILDELIYSRIGNTLVALSSVVIGVTIFVVCIILSKLFSNEELEHIPKIRKLAAFMQSKIGK